MKNNCPSFSPQDFEGSIRWKGGGSQKIFHAWEASTANSALEKWLGETSLAGILDFLRMERQKYAVLQGHKDAERFGEVRIKHSVTHLSWGNVDIMARANRDLFNLLQTPIRLQGFSDLPNQTPRLCRTIYFENESTSPIETTRISKYLVPTKIGSYSYKVGTLVLEHTDPKNSQKILESICELFEAVRSKRIPKEECLTLFSKAFYGYFHAMPYTRGSASVGKLLLVCMLQAFFGKKMPATKLDVDLWVMTALNEKEFQRDFPSLVGLGPSTSTT